MVIKGAELRGSASEGSNDLTHKHLEGVEAFAVAHHDGTKEVIDAVDANDDITSDEEEPNVVRPKKGGRQTGARLPAIREGWWRDTALP